MKQFCLSMNLNLCLWLLVILFTLKSWSPLLWILTVVLDMLKLPRLVLYLDSCPSPCYPNLPLLTLKRSNTHISCSESNHHAQNHYWKSHTMVSWFAANADWSPVSLFCFCWIHFLCTPGLSFCFNWKHTFSLPCMLHHHTLFSLNVKLSVGVRGFDFWFQNIFKAFFLSTFDLLFLV